MWHIIAKKEIKQAFSNRVFILLGLIVWIIIGVSALSGYKNYRNIKKQQEHAKELFKEELAEKERDPHSAAHFGTYLFKPLTFLSLYDPGVNDYSGSTYRVEAHRQSQMNLANARDTSAILRLGELSISTVFQLLIPLLLIFFSFSSISKEREEGTLKLLFTQGLGIRSLIWGKIFGNYSIVMLISLPVFLIILASGLLGTESFIRTLLFVVAYGFYFFIITCICILVSYRTKTSGASLLSLLCIWTLLFLIVPKLIAGIATTTYPLISYNEFTKQMELDYSNGIENDGTRGERTQKLEKEILKKYNVHTVSELPINLDGLMLQNSEDYLSKVYRARSIPVEEQLERQKAIFKLGAFFTPYNAINQLSMAISGTDLYQHQDFHKKAGKYRDYFVRTLNMELAKGEKNEAGQYTVSTTFLKNMEQFTYVQPSVNFVFHKYPFILLSFLFWMVLLIFLIELSIKKQNIL